MPLLTGHTLLFVVVVVGCSFSAWRLLACKPTVKITNFKDTNLEEDPRQDGKIISAEAGTSQRS
jgi:hypothetical protein